VTSPPFLGGCSTSRLSCLPVDVLVKVQPYVDVPWVKVRDRHELAYAGDVAHATIIAVVQLYRTVPAHAPRVWRGALMLPMPVVPT
jgi:hypothetical protein